MAVLLLALVPQLVYGDRGMIPVVPGVSVYEPGQKAIIAWNGREEILILSTDVYSSKKTLVFEMLPLPSKPEKIELASFGSFEEVQRLIFGRIVKMYRALDKAAKEVTVVFHEKIGAHDITVVQAGDTLEFVGWMEDFLKKSGIEREVSLKDFEPVVRDYMARGFRFYVLDLIEVSLEQNSVEPILYKFETSFFYYPLKITSPLEGETRIALFTLTEGTIQDGYYPLRKATYRTSEGQKPIEFRVSNGELSKIDLRIGELFREGAWLTVLLYEGKLSNLTSDIMIPEEAVTPFVSPTIKIDVVIPVHAVVTYMITGALCTLAGMALMFIIMRLKRRAET